jgi:hypothetical protein
MSFTGYTYMIYIIYANILDFKNYMVACTWHKVVKMYLQYLRLTDTSFMETKSSF